MFTYLITSKVLSHITSTLSVKVTFAGAIKVSQNSDNWSFPQFLPVPIGSSMQASSLYKFNHDNLSCFPTVTGDNLTRLNSFYDNDSCP